MGLMALTRSSDSEVLIPNSVPYHRYRHIASCVNGSGSERHNKMQYITAIDPLHIAR